MGKVFGILLIVIAIWLGLQYYTSDPPGPDPERSGTTRAQAVGERVSDALESGAERREALIPE